MKRLESSLNPYAPSYIPLTNREANKTFITETSSHDRIGEPYLHNPPFDNRSPRLNAPVAVASAVNNHPFHGSISQRSNELTETVMFDRQFNLDLEFLQANFSELSEEFLIGVYLASEGDLEAAVDMLNQLESKHPPDYDYDCESLPDTLGIGDTSESGFAAVGQPSFEVKNVANSASTPHPDSRSESVGFEK